jgi:hypothetical protein
VIATILVVLSRYPLELTRNTCVSGAFFSALFLSDAARLFIDSMNSRLYVLAVDWGQGIFAFFCLLTWTVLVQPEAPKPAKIKFSTPADDHLLEQLASLNQLLGRTVRR